MPKYLTLRVGLSLIPLSLILKSGIVVLGFLKTIISVFVEFNEILLPCRVVSHDMSDISET